MTMSDDGDLLDASALIALVAEDHVHHEVMETWVATGSARLATCPITQGALLRFLIREGATGEEARVFLHRLLTHHRFHFWEDDIGYDEVDLGAVVGHRQVTDAYLAGLARKRGRRLITLDRGLAALHPDGADMVPT